MGSEALVSECVPDAKPWCKTVYHFSSTGSVNTRTLLPYIISANCSCCVMLRAGNYKGGQFCRQASSLPNALFYLGLFAKQLPVMRFPSGDKSFLSMLSAVNFVKLPRFKLGTIMVPFF